MRNAVFNVIGAGIGDIICLLPIVDNFIKRNYEVDIVVSESKIKACNNLLKSRRFTNADKYNFIRFEDFVNDDYTYNFNLKVAPRFDEAVSETVSCRTDVYEKLCEIELPKKKKVAAINDLPIEKEKAVFLSQGSLDEKRRISDIKFSNLINLYHEAGYIVYYHEIIPLKVKQSDSIINVSEWTMEHMLEAILASEFVVTTDNLIMHLAGLFNIKTYCLFSSFKKEERAPYYKSVENITKPISCIACHLNVCNYKFKCLSIDPKLVFKRTMSS